ncbi:putative tape measure protein [Dissostichus eleginoides]|uniref:Tape measure protein n=1 Tax=Dissostichus eleginoides TaxID=100907 RepID=A0AAD9BCN3_DISEL|nr:putative tape measure protein [Dissostichus eleginoides]
MATLQGDNSASKECEGSSEANANTIDNTDNAILQAINGLKTVFFSSKLDGLLSAVNSVKGELTSCQKRISETEE